MTLDEVDYFSDEAVVIDPLPYFEHLRTHGPAVRIPGRNVVAVTGYDQAVAVLLDDENFSAAISPIGPIPPLPFIPEGDDITDQIAEYRHLIPFGGIIPTQDPPEHGRLKSLLMGMITPKRMKENEAAMWALADRQIDRFIDRREVELLGDYALHFSGVVIADLLGVPADDYEKLDSIRPPIAGQIGVDGSDTPNNSFSVFEGYFADCIEQRRREPRADVLGQLAKVCYADGTIATVEDVAKISGFLFGAGQGTTARLIAACLRFIAEDPELQARLRADRSLIPNFVEETLRLAGSIKATFRLAKKPVRIGDIDAAPGTTVMVLLGAINRDPKHYEEPNAFRLDRRTPRDHLSFSRGIHTCVGAPLARAEAKISIERMLDRTVNISLDDGKHGPAGQRRFDYIPNYLMRALGELHLNIEPIG